MNPLQVRPELVCVVVQPTVPVAYTSFALPPVNMCTSPVQHSNALSPFCMSPADVALDGKTTTAKTRRELEHLGSTRRATELIFELAARKNGIRIGVDHRSKATSGGKVQQDDSLEDFKKIAQLNGITVCLPGSKVKKDSDSAYSQVAGTNPTDDSVTRHCEGMCMSTSHISSLWESGSPSPVGNFFEPNNNHNDVTCFEEKGVIGNEVRHESSATTNTLDLFKIKAAASGIKVQYVTELNESQKPELTQLGKQFSENSETVLGMGDLVTCVSADSDSATTNVEHANEAESYATILQYMDENTRPEREIFGEDSENKSKIHKYDEKARLSEVSEEMEATTTCSEEGTASDGGTNNAREDQHDNEDVLSSLQEDAEVVVFQEIAHHKGIKVGNSLRTTRLSTISCESDVVESIEADGPEFLEFTEDAQIAKFQEMARLNGIRVGGKRQESPFYSDDKESFTSTHAKENDCWSETPYFFGEHCQIVSFQEFGRVKDIKVTGKFPDSSSCSSLSPASSEDNLCYPCREGSPLIPPACRTADTFEELANRNGIKIGKVVTTAASVDALRPPRSSETCSYDKSLKREPTAVFTREASAQTEVNTADYWGQTCEKDLGLFKRTTGVQVDAVREAFEQEFKEWKLDDNAAGNDEELCYKELYLTERNACEALKDSLQNEKDVSANTKHCYKRVMGELKEELKSQTEEIEKLKKDLKTVKKQQETEAKRTTKDLKSKEEELKSTKGSLQLKEVAIEGLRSIIKDQSEKLKTVEEQLEETKTLFSSMRENSECSTCATHRKAVSHSSQKEALNDQTDDGWKLYTSKKSRSTLFKQICGKKGDGNPPSVGSDEMCVSNEVSLLSSFRQRNGDGTRLHGGETTVQALNYADCGMASPENRETVAPTEQETRIQEVIQTPSPQDISKTVIQNVESSTTQPENNLLLSHVSPKAGNGNEGYATKQSAEAEDQRAAQKSSSSDGRNPILPTNIAVPNLTGQHQTLQQFLPIQPQPFSGLPTHIIAQYLAGLVVQPKITSENNLPDSCKPLRPPPGLCTEPVPAKDQQQLSPPARPAGKFSSFEKLMERLHKKFPDKSRQELIVYLRKAKAAAGVAGFRGKHIAHVIKCVEEVIEEKPDLKSAK